MTRLKMHKTLVILSVLLARSLGQGRFRAIVPKAVPRAIPRASFEPQSPGREVRIISQTADVDTDGSYRWSFEADNGISAQEQGQLKGGNAQDAVGEAQGQFQYTSPDGTPLQITYIANENGFQPQGAHLPVPPPIPIEIQRALEWNAAHPEEDNAGGGGGGRRP
ncbi:unnamed protein product [Callosobruchus maculatus]|uniref:Uncharacterized protein n=1 Tax=Callosobruchus maculatus TaxID=64391 RepID=A0A653CF69_CALMS|nr:unnamed protein product [Callosobruchus maculatus]